MPRKIILIRHGETDYNRDRKWQGWIDVPLNKTGLKQAEKLAKRLKSEIIDVLFSSDLKRASLTAETIAKKLVIKPNKTRKLRERNLGILEGVGVNKSQEKFKHIIDNIFNHQDETFKGHGGETLKEAKKRLESFLTFLREKYKDQIVAIVTHGGTKYYLLTMLLKEMPKQELKFDNAGITVLKKDRWGEYHLTMISDTSHLQEK